MFFSREKQTDLVRYGMYKNYRVGCVKYYQNPVNGSCAYILVDTIEWCIGTEDTYYSSYNLYVEVDQRFSERIGIQSVGKWILFGFYIQSFKSDNNFTTALRLRHYEELNGNEINTLEIKDFRMRGSDNMRIVMAPDVAVNLMKEISNKTKFNEYGKR